MAQTKLKVTTSDKPEARLAALCTKALDAKSGDWHAATALVHRELAKAPELLERLAASTVDAVVTDYCRAAAHRRRGSYFKGQAPKAPHRNAALIAIGIQNWFDCPLPSSVRLGDCDKGELAKNRASYLERVAGNQQRADWLKRLSKELKPGKTVQESMTNERIDEISRQRGVKAESV